MLWVKIKKCVVFKNKVDNLNFILSVLLVADVCQCNVKSVFLCYSVLMITCCKAKNQKIETSTQ